MGGWGNWVIIVNNDHSCFFLFLRPKEEKIVFFSFRINIIKLGKLFASVFFREKMLQYFCFHWIFPYFLSWTWLHAIKGKIFTEHWNDEFVCLLPVFMLEKCHFRFFENVTVTESCCEVKYSMFCLYSYISSFFYVDFYSMTSQTMNRHFSNVDSDDDDQAVLACKNTIREK